MSDEKSPEKTTDDRAAKELRYASDVVAGLLAMGPGLTDRDRAVFIAAVIAKARAEGFGAGKEWAREMLRG